MNTTIEQALTILDAAGIEVYSTTEFWYLGENCDVFFSDKQVISIAESIQLTM